MPLVAENFSSDGASFNGNVFKVMFCFFPPDEGIAVVRFAGEPVSPELLNFCFEDGNG